MIFSTTTCRVTYCSPSQIVAKNIQKELIKELNNFSNTFNQMALEFRYHILQMFLFIPFSTLLVVEPRGGRKKSLRLLNPSYNVGFFSVCFWRMNASKFLKFFILRDLMQYLIDFQRQSFVSSFPDQNNCLGRFWLNSSRWESPVPILPASHRHIVTQIVISNDCTFMKPLPSSHCPSTGYLYRYIDI